MLYTQIVFVLKEQMYIQICLPWTQMPEKCFFEII